jgi:hypothetical protein
MKNVTRWFIVSALAATGALAFACGGGSSEGGGSSTPSASAPATTSAPVQSSAAAATTTAPTVTPTMLPPITIVAMKLSGPKLKGTVEIKDDGSIVGPDGKTVAKITSAEMQDKDGKTLVSVSTDGAVTIAGAQHGGKFNDKNELVIDNGAKFSIDDSGALNLIDEKGQKDKDSGKLKFAGFKPEGRRAALVLFLGMMIPTSVSTTTSASVGPASSAKPATTAKKP